MIDTLVNGTVEGLKMSLLLLLFFIIVIAVEALIGAGDTCIKVTLLLGCLLLLIVNIMLAAWVVPLGCCILIAIKRRKIADKMGKSVDLYFQRNINLKKFNRNTKYIAGAGIVLLPIGYALWVWGNSL